MSVQAQASAIKSLSKPSDRSNDGALQLALETSWENYLSPAPMCIALLGQVQLVASIRDFSIEESAPRDGFKYLRYPKSFRACLQQVVNEGWNAFDLAGRNMSQITLTSEAIPVQIQDVFKTIVKGTAQEVEMLLPDMLSQISRDAQSCESLAVAVDKGFMGIMNLTGELLEVCTQQKGISETKRQQAVAALQANKALADTLAQQAKLKETQVKELQDTVKKSQDQFDKTVKSMPSGWDLIGMNIVESLGKTFTNALDRTMSLGLPTLLNLGKKDKDVQGQIGSAGGAQPSNPNNIPVTIDKALDHADQLLSTIQMLGAIDVKGKDDKNKQAPTFIDTMLTDLKKQIQGLPQTVIAKQVNNLCTQGIDLAKRMAQAAGGMSVDDETIKKFKQEADNMTTQAEGLQAQAKLANTRDLAPTVSPGQYNTMANNKNLSAGEIAQKNWQLAMEATQKAMEDSRKRFDEQSENLQKMQLRQAELIGEMGKLDIDKINFDQIIEVLKKGITALGELREQWSSMCQFFAMLVTIVKMSNSLVQQLADRTAKLSEMRLSNGGSLSDMSIDMLYELCIRADQTARVTNMISKTYVKVSNAHVVGPMAALSKLSALDAATDGPQISQMQAKLVSDARASQTAILDLVTNSKRDFARQIEQRSKQVQQALKSVIPAGSDQTKKQIDDASKKVDEVNKKADQIKEEDKKKAGYDDDFLS